MAKASPYRIAVATLALAYGLALGPAVAADGMEPLLEATLQLKVQSYDRNVGNRLGSKAFVIAILYKPGSSASEAAAGEMRGAFGRVAETFRLRGIKPTVATIAFDAAGLAETLRAQGATLIYVTRGLESALPAILKTSGQLQVPTVTNQREHVAAGVAIGIVVERRKPRIVVNLASVEACGMALEAEMLELAEVVR